MAPAWKTWTALGIVYVVWGSTYLGIRVVVETMPPLVAGGARFLMAGALMAAGLALFGELRSVRVSRAEIGGAVLVGCLLVTGGNGVVMIAEEHVASSLAALIMASIPLWVIVMRRGTGERIPGATLGGVAIGFAGVALLVGPGGSGHSEAGWLLVLVGAAFSWAAGTFVGSRSAMPADPLVSTTIQMLAGGALSLVLGLAFGEAGRTHFSHFSGRSIVAFAYLVVIGSLVAFTAFAWLMRNVPVSKAATYAYVNPVIAVVLGWLILDERITGLIVLAAAVIVSSVAVIVRRESVPTGAELASEP